MQLQNNILHEDSLSKLGETPSRLSYASRCTKYSNIANPRRCNFKLLTIEKTRDHCWIYIGESCLSN